MTKTKWGLTANAVILGLFHCSLVAVAGLWANSPSSAWISAIPVGLVLAFFLTKISAIMEIRRALKRWHIYCCYLVVASGVGPLTVVYIDRSEWMWSIAIANPMMAIVLMLGLAYALRDDSGTPQT